MVLLLLNEYWNYKAYNSSTLMYVDKNRGSDNVKVNIDIEFPNLPCDLLSIEIKNNLGLNVRNIEGNLTKYSLNNKHEIIGNKPYALESLGKFGHDHDHIAQPDFESIKTQIKNQEGCKLKGEFYVDAVPGTFIISPKAFSYIIGLLRKEGITKVNVEHDIKELYFGERISKFRLFVFPNAYSLMHTLKNKKRINDKLPMAYQYYLKIVPTKYQYLSGLSFNSYQYTANSFSEISLDRIPALFFRYDLSSITVEYKHTKMSFLSFIINIIYY